MVTHPAGWVVTCLSDSDEREREMKAQGLDTGPITDDTRRRAMVTELRQVAKAPSQHPTWRLRALLDEVADMLEKVQ